MSSFGSEPQLTGTKWPRRPALIVQRPRDQLLAGSGLAQHQHRQRHHREPRDLAAQPLHRRRLPDDLGVDLGVHRDAQARGPEREHQPRPQLAVGTRTPLRIVPLVDARSRTSTRSSVGSITQWRRETHGSSMRRSTSSPVPSTIGCSSGTRRPSGKMSAMRPEAAVVVDRRGADLQLLLRSVLPVVGTPPLRHPRPPLNVIKEVFGGGA